MKISENLSQNIEALVKLESERYHREEKDSKYYTADRDDSSFKYEIEEILTGNIRLTLGFMIGKVEGYTGYEDGGSVVCFTCRIDNHFWRVVGHYSSWDGTEYYWNEAEYLGELIEEEVEVVYKRTQWVDRDGNVKIHEDKLNEKV